MRSLLGRFHRPMSRGAMGDMLTMNSLGDGSTLSLDFTTMGGVLDPRLTFSRASTATFVNSSGYVEWAASNQMTYSQSQDSVSFWNDFGTNVVRTSAQTDPNGGTAAVKLVFNASAGDAAISRTVAISNGLPYTISMWMRSDSGTISNVRFARGSTPTGAIFPTLTTTWQRVSLSFTATTTTDGIEIRVLNSGSPQTATFHVYGAQLESGSTVRTYQPAVAAAAYHAPRFDYSPTNIGEPRGLLIEAQTANACFNSQALTTGWLNANMNTPTNPAIADPFGGTSATWKLVAPISASALRGWRHAVVTLTAANYTFSFWAKAAEFDRIVLGDPGSGRGGCRFVLVGNGTATVIAGSTTPTNPTIEQFPGEWYRCSVTMLMAATTYAMGIAGYPSTTTPNEYGATYEQTNLHGVYATGFQIELGSGASSYIPTGASGVTRNGDQVVLSNLVGILFSQSAGTMYSQVELVEKLRGSFIPYGSFDTSGGGRGWWWLRHNHDTSVGQRILGTAFNSVGSTGISTANYTHSSGVFKFATSLDTSVARMVYVINGGSAQTTTATGFTLATAAQLSLNKNNDVGINDLGSMWIRTIKYWPTALPDAQLTSITT